MASTGKRRETRWPSVSRTWSTASFTSPNIWFCAVTVVAGLLAALTAFVAGASGFGFGLMATPLLLLCGFALPFVVTVNLLISLATRVSVSWRFRRVANRRRVIVLIGGGALPGLWLGSRTLGAVDANEVKRLVGAIVACAAVARLGRPADPPNPRVRGLNLVAYFFGGVLGTITSLTGVPPALLLARRRLAQPTFFADLSVYFVAPSAAGLAVLAADGKFSSDAGDLRVVAAGRTGRECARNDLRASGCRRQVPLGDAGPRVRRGRLDRCHGLSLRSYRSSSIHRPSSM